MTNKHSNKDKSIFLCTEYLGAIHYFDNIQLHNFLSNNELKILCKKDLENLRIDKQKRPYNIQDELALSGFYEADLKELNKLFEAKFNQSNRFRTKETFAKYEHDYMKGIWSNTDILKRIPISKQWLEFLENIADNKDHSINNNSGGTSNKSKKRGRPKAEVKKLKEYINKGQKYVDNLKICLGDTLQNDVKNEDYQSTKMLLFYLKYKCKTNYNYNKEFAQSVWNEFIKEEPITPSFERMANKTLKNPDHSNLANPEFKKLKKLIKKIIV